MISFSMLPQHDLNCYYFYFIIFFYIFFNATLARFKLLDLRLLQNNKFFQFFNATLARFKQVYVSFCCYICDTRFSMLPQHDLNISLLYCIFLSALLFNATLARFKRRLYRNRKNNNRFSMLPQHDLNALPLSNKYIY